MNNEQLRARIKEHWRSFDAFAESQNGVNGAIIRALDVFQGAQGKLLLCYLEVKSYSYCILHRISVVYGLSTPVLRLCSNYPLRTRVPFFFII